MEWNEMTSHPIIYRSTLCKLISYVTWARCDMHNLAINFNNVINTLLIKKIKHHITVLIRYLVTKNKNTLWNCTF